MNRLHSLALLAGLPAASIVAWRLGGESGAGAMLGASAALALSIAGLAWQGWALRRRPKYVVLAFVATFLAKLAALAGGACWLRFDATVAQRFDWSAYLLGFAAAAVWAMFVATIAHARRPVASKELRA